MTTIYDPPTTAEPGHTPPYAPWPGSAGPGGPDGPAGYGGWGDGPRKPARRFRHPAMLAATALVFGLGSFFVVKTSGIASSNTVLTTAQIAAKTDPSLVDINTNLGLQGGAAAGTGQVLTSNGEILTNNHVIAGATSIKATDIGNGRTYTAKVVGYDQTKDIAVIQLQGASGLQTADLGNSSSAAVGQKVVALGNALGKGGTPSVVTGHITGLNASITAQDEGAATSENLTGLIHHNAPIQPGDSGGPLVNTYGQVVGINTAASSGFQFQSGATQAFAIPINEAMSIASQIVAGHSSSDGAHRPHRPARRPDHAREQRRGERHPGGQRRRGRRGRVRNSRRPDRPGRGRRDHLGRRPGGHLTEGTPDGTGAAPPG